MLDIQSWNNHHMKHTAERPSDLLIPPLGYIALGLLMAQPRHGYELYQELRQAFGGVWNAGRSQFYAALADLHAAGFLDMTTQAQESRPPRKVYHLTQVGREAFTRWLYQPVDAPREVRVVLLIKLRFFDLLGLPDVERLLDAQIARCQARLEEEVHRAAAHRQAAGGLYRELVHEFRRGQLAAMIEWLHACRQRLVKGG